MIIDADAHVEESESMFEYLDKEFYPRRPLAIRLEGDTVLVPIRDVHASIKEIQHAAQNRRRGGDAAWHGLGQTPWG